MSRKRRNPLVCQHIENLSSAAFEKHEQLVREIVGRRHGVYALYRKDRLYYVGLATNLRNRIKAHLKDRHRGLWDRFSAYLTINDAHLKELESLTIRIAHPKGNKQGGRFAQSENLTRVLRSRYREQQRAEWLDLIGRGNKASAHAVGKGKRRMQRSDVPLSGVFARATTIRAEFKGRTYRARVRRDGRIRVGKQVADSPSRAGRMVTGRSTPGWLFWKYERAPGQWVRLRELKRA